MVLQAELGLVPSLVSSKSCGIETFVIGVNLNTVYRGSSLHCIFTFVQNINVRELAGSECRNGNSEMCITQ